MRKSPVNRKNPALVPGSGRSSHLPDGGEGREQQAGCLNWRVTDREGFAISEKHETINKQAVNISKHISTGHSKFIVIKGQLCLCLIGSVNSQHTH